MWIKRYYCKSTGNRFSTTKDRIQTANATGENPRSILCKTDLWIFLRVSIDGIQKPKNTYKQQQQQQTKTQKYK